jgi:hypothetical protein
VGNAVNALPPTRGGHQVAFKLDYSGGWGLYHKLVWKTLKNVCRAYTGPNLHWPWLFVGCTAPDGSYWAVQSFPDTLPDLGFTPWTAAQRATVLQLSHWKGALPQLQVWQDWVMGGKYNEIFGQLTYQANLCTASPAPTTAPRPTRSVGSSTWTPTTPPTGRAGDARTRS